MRVVSIFEKGGKRRFNLFYFIYLSIYISIEYVHLEQIKSNRWLNVHTTILFQETKKKNKNKTKKIHFDIKLM